MRIKILHVVNVMDRGGQETMIMNLYRKINREKFQFCFLCSSLKTGDYDKEIGELGGLIYYLPEYKKRHGILAIKNIYEKSLLLKNWLQNNRSKFDCVHLHTSHAADVLTHLIGCKLAGVEHIIIHSHNTQAPHPLYHKFCRFITSFFKFRKMACGERAAEWLYGKKQLQNGKVFILHNGIEVDRFVYNKNVAKQIRTQLGISNKTVYGHVGRFAHQKNHTFLLDVFFEIQKMQSNSVLLLIGDGELKEEMIEKTKRLGIDDKVFFLGVREDVSQLLSAMDLFMFPSLHEGLSVVAIEVQCNGLHCLSSDIPSMREAKITPLMTFESLDNTPKQWALTAIQLAFRDVDFDSGSMIKTAKYDIEQSVNMIENVYTQYIQI